MSEHAALGIDFGTSNTYFCKSAGDQPLPSSIDFGTGHDGIATAVLYRREREPLVGDEALHEWGEATEVERRDYSLHIHFKPDVGVSEDAARYAEDFLRNLVIQWERRHVDISPADRQVIIGVPSEAGGEFTDALRALAQRAGYGDVRTVPEPIGALLHHLHRKDLSAVDAQRGVLVVDFGGGTCDFAYMTRLEVRHSWGDMQLGGRLFDDLFYRWFLEQNPGASDALDRENAAYFVHWHECRELKELFSRTMARDRSEKVRKRINAYGVVDGLTWHEFMARARDYRPTTSFRQHLRQSGAPHAELTVGDLPHDLIGWFRGTLIEGLTAHSIRPANVERVILAGGSSQWPFVSDIIEEVLQIGLDGDGMLLRSDRPYAAVGEGLAILPALQARSEAARDALTEGLPTFFDDRIQPLVDDTLYEVVRLVAQDTATDLYDRRVRPLLETFRAEGGTFNDLEKQIAAAVKQHEPDYLATVQEHMALLEQGLPTQVQGAVAAWFAEHDLPPTREMVHLKIANFPSLPSDMTGEVPNLNQDMADAASIIAATVATVTVGSLAGGTGTAFIAQGPPGWIAGALLGALGSGALLIYGRERMKVKMKCWKVPRPVLKLGLSQTKMEKILTEGREKYTRELARGIRKHLALPLAGLRKQIRELVQKEIDSLSAIDQI